MGEPALLDQRLTVEEYFALEDESEIRHEYWNGHLRAMAGSSPAHVSLSSQLSRFLNNKLDGSPCQAGNSDMGVRVESENSYFYPDVTVWCENAEFEEKHPRVLLTPILIAEVLSPTTSAIDRGAKLDAYLQIPSLRDYLILSTERVSIQHYSRVPGQDWRYRQYVLRDQVIRLDHLNIELSVADLYRRLDVPESSGLTIGLPLESTMEESS